MSANLERGSVVVDTDVFSARLIPNSLLAQRYEPVLTGHALHQRDHDADRWIAATAIRLGIPLVSNDGVFKDTPGLEWITVPM